MSEESHVHLRDIWDFESMPDAITGEPFAELGLSWEVGIVFCIQKEYE